MRADALVWAWYCLGAGTLLLIIYQIRESSFNSGYWKGRQAGWESHRRITNIAKKSDEVFDYEKN
jgi:hypothetical protein